MVTPRPFGRLAVVHVFRSVVKPQSNSARQLPGELPGFSVRRASRTVKGDLLLVAPNAARRRARLVRWGGMRVPAGIERAWSAPRCQHNEGSDRNRFAGHVYGLDGHARDGLSHCISAAEPCWRTRSIPFPAVTGEAMPVASRVFSFAKTGAADFSVSDRGAIAYQNYVSRSQLVWVDRAGRQLATIGPANINVKSARLSPDGQRLATAIYDIETRRAGSLDLRCQNELRGGD